MATIYTEINGTIDPLVARIYADGVDIYDGFISGGEFTPPHPLRSCTTFQWQYDNLAGAGWLDIDGAIDDTFQVDTSMVANSGSYRCIITVGSEQCQQITDVRTISIIDCRETEVPVFPGTGGMETIAIDFPHYERNNITITAPDWITHTAITCASPTVNVCEEIITLTASAPDTNFARNGYFDVQVGDFLCSYSLQQSFVAAAPEPDPPMDAAAPAPAGSLLVSVQNPEVQVGSTTTVTASTYILRDDGTFDPNIQASDVTWTITNEDGDPVPQGNGPDRYTVAGPSLIPWVVATINVDTTEVATKFYDITATINGLDAVRRSDNVSIVAEPVTAANGVISGDTFDSVTARTLVLRREAPRLGSSAAANGTFNVDAGTANIEFRFSDRGGLAQRYAYTGNAMLYFRIAGPGITGGSYMETISLAAGPEQGPDYSIIDPSTWPEINQVIRNASNFTDAGHLTVGSYNWNMEVVDPGGQGTRFWNSVFSPGISMLVTPIYNFFSI